MLPTASCLGYSCRHAGQRTFQQYEQPAPPGGHGCHQRSFRGSRALSHSPVIARPSSSRVHGCHPSTLPALVGSSAQRRGSPGLGDAHSGSPDQPTSEASCSTTSSTEVAAPVPISTRPVASVCTARARASTASSTNRKSRSWRPSPSTRGACAWSIDHAVLPTRLGPSGSWRGPYTVPNSSTAESSPRAAKALEYASSAKRPAPSGCTGAGRSSALVTPLSWLGY